MITMTTNNSIRVIPRVHCLLCIIGCGQCYSDQEPISALPASPPGTPSAP
jgi:hypothetical protein